MATATSRSLSGFLFILVLAAALTAARKAIAVSMPLPAFIEVIALEIPRFFLFSLPMSLLYGTIQTFSDLSIRGELTALSAGGMSLGRMVKAPLAWAAVLVVIAFAVQEIIVPKSEMGSDSLMTRELREGIGVQRNFSFRDPLVGPLKRIIQAESFDPRSNTLVHPSLLFFDSLDINIAVTAQRGTWDIESGRWKFYKGKIITYPKGKSVNEAFSVVQTFDSIERTDIPNPDSLNQAIITRNDHIAKGDYETVSMAELADYRSTLENQMRQARTPSAIDAAQKAIVGATYGIHDKIATPLICFALVMVGVPLGLRPQRSAGGLSIGLALMVILLYYMVWTWASYPAKAGTANPYVMAYCALVITTGIGTLLLWKKNR